MRKLLLIGLLVIPALCYGQVHVGPDGYMLVVFWAVALAVPVIGVLALLAKRAPVMKMRRRNKPEVHLIGNKSENPDVLTLFIANQTGKPILFNSPVLEFRKWLKKRKFKLKSSSKGETYPFRLENDREYELQIKLDVFHKHDPVLFSYLKGRIIIESTAGQKYTSKWIRLRKHLK